MGQAPCCSCGDKRASAAARKAFDESSRIGIVLLHTVELGAFSDGPLAEANEAMLEAVTLGRRGHMEEAFERLAAAESVLRGVPKSAAATQLRRACCTDPELQEIRFSPTNAPQPRKKIKKGGSKRKSDGAQEGTATDAETDAVLVALKADLSQLHGLCGSVRLFEASEKLDQVEGAAKQALKACGGSGGASEQALRCFAEGVREDPMLQKVRAINGRMQAATALIRGADTRGCAPIVIKDPDLGDDFRLELVLRPAEGKEVEKGGATTQLLAILRVFNWPLSLLKCIAVDCEVDLFQKEWIKDCKDRTGTVGGPQVLFSNLTTFNVALAPLPISLEEVQVREFAVCPTPLLQNCGPGVLVLETSPGGEHGRWENWAIPKSAGKRGTYRLASGSKVHYKMRSQKGADWTDFVSVSKVGLPVPSWLLPLDTFRGIVASKVKESLKLMKDRMIDHWAEHGYEERIETNQAFYGSVAAVQAAGGAGPA